MREKRIRVLLVDDHLVVREGFAALLSLHEDLVAVGQAPDGETALRRYAELAPDVVLLDLSLPDMDGLEVLAELHRRDPGAKVLILTTFGGGEALYRAISAGALGFLSKSSSANELFEAIRHASEGEQWLSSRALASLAMRANTEPLTRRELQVLAVMAEGKTNETIADHIGVSLNTVRTHVYHILQKLHAATRTEAVVKAAARGLIRR